MKAFLIWKPVNSNNSHKHVTDVLGTQLYHDENTIWRIIITTERITSRHGSQTKFNAKAPLKLHNDLF